MKSPTIFIKKQDNSFRIDLTGLIIDHTAKKEYQNRQAEEEAGFNNYANRRFL